MRTYPSEAVKGRDLPSVTSVLDMISKPQLYSWYGAKGNAECKRILAESAARGTATHEAIERHLFGDERGWEVVVTAPYKAGALGAIKELDIPKEGIRSEVTVRHEAAGYAGTFDLLYPSAGGLTLLDWKTSSAIYPEYGLQLAAYAKAFELGSDEKVKRLLVVRVGKDGEYEIGDFSEKKESNYLTFLAALELFLWRHPKYRIQEA